MAKRKLTAAAVEQLGESWISPRTGRPISEAQARRYAVAGVSRAEYESGAKVSAARGHRDESAEKQRRSRGIYNDPIIRAAQRKGLLEDVPTMTEFSREQQLAIATSYLATFMPEEHKRSKIVQNYLETHPGREAFTDFAELLSYMENPFEGMSSHDNSEAWKRAREVYNTHTGFVLHGKDWTPSDTRHAKRTWRNKA